ncbi:hypothetical protein K440DRAFT_610664 [Wilcoxina mikolae CBS 423.85]|nr:hypothetical protein K440DRAFT_610664 [Wilcoxina mikolae CBS 423.85]
MSRWQWLWSFLQFGWRSSNCPCRSLYPTLVDEFTIHGPNVFTSAVIKVLGPSLRDLMPDDRDDIFLKPAAQRLLFSWYKGLQSFTGMVL